MSRTRLPTLLLAALLGSALVAPADADEAPPEPAVETSPTAIPVEDVADEAGYVAQRLRSFEPSPRTLELIADAESDRDQIVRQIRPRLERSRGLLTSRATVYVLRGLRSELVALERLIAAGESVLDDQVKHLADGLRELDQMRGVWAATQAAHDRATTPEEVLRRIDVTLEAIETGTQQLRTQRDAVLTLLDRFVDEREKLEGAVQGIDGQIEARLGQLFWADRPPLWRADLRAELEGAPVRAELDELAAYLGQRAQPLGLQLLAVVTTALLFRALSTRLPGRLPRHPELADVQRVWELPYSMALILTVATPEIVYSLHPLAPPLYSVLLVGLVVVVPVVRICRRTLPDRLRVAVLALLALFVADRIHFLLTPMEALARWFHVLQLGGALGFSFWFQRSGATRQVVQPQVRLAVIGARVAIPLLLMALVAELVGWIQLGAMVGTGTLHVALRTLVIYALLQVARALVGYALTTRLAERLNLVRRHRLLVRERLFSILGWLAVLVWLIAILHAYGLAVLAQELLQALLATGLSVGELSVTFGDFAAFGLTLASAIVLARLVGFALEEEVYPRVRLPRGIPYALSALARYSLLLLGFLFALAAAGIELGRLTILAGGLGVGIGFGLQNMTNNFVSGLILLFERPLGVGDTVELPTLVGHIRRIGIRATVIETLSGAEVIVPNGLLVSELVTNWTLSHPRRRIELAVGVAYGTSAQRVIDLLHDVARSCEGVLEDPAPQAFFVGFGDSALEFLVRVWTSRYELEYPVRSGVAVAIQRALDEAGIAVPFPQRDLHLKTVAPEAQAVFAGREPS